MSSAFVPFLFELRARKIKVGTQEALALARALAAGLHDSSLDGFYHVARALTCTASRTSTHSTRRLPRTSEAFGSRPST